MKKSKKSKPGKMAKVTAPKPPPDKEEERFDFGGIPSRDLKKNLGCG